MYENLVKAVFITPSEEGLEHQDKIPETGFVSPLGSRLKQVTLSRSRVSGGSLFLLHVLTVSSIMTSKTVYFSLAYHQDCTMGGLTHFG